MPESGGDSMTVTLPFPAPELFPNRRNGQHWGKTNNAKEAAKDAAFWLTKQAMNGYTPPDGYIPLSVVFVTPTRHRRDWDGMAGAFKAAQDGIAAALGIDDSRFKPVLVDWVEGSKPGACIVAVGVAISSGANL